MNWLREHPYAEKSSPLTTSLPVEWDVTQIVQAWADGTMVNNGFILLDPNDTPTYTPALRMTLFDSMEYNDNKPNRRPILEIEYR
jgi:hypothetical protein